jgi:RimJ/RimL family protein N-acetyltransferase
MIGNARIRLRPTLIDDLDYVITVENDPVNRPSITPWERTQHEAAVRFPDFRHFIVEAGDALEPVGFVILVGCRSPHKSIELKRMVIQSKGQGLGRACLRLLKKIAFEDLRAHRFWLDVKTHNVRAKALYDKEGFVEEGRLRDCVRTDDGYESLVVMSLLESEYSARCGAGLEAA